MNKKEATRPNGCSYRRERSRLQIKMNPTFINANRGKVTFS